MAEWSKAHAWSACVPLCGTASSNLAPSALEWLALNYVEFGAPVPYVVPGEFLHLRPKFNIREDAENTIWWVGRVVECAAFEKQ